MKTGEVYRLVHPREMGCNESEAGALVKVTHKDGHIPTAWVASKIAQGPVDGSWCGCLISDNDVDEGRIVLEQEAS